MLLSLMAYDAIVKQNKDASKNVYDGINRNNAQPDFIPSCENLIGNNLIEQ